MDVTDASPLADAASRATPDRQLRPSARLLMVDPHDRVLLVPVRDPVDGRRWWEIPGGGVEAGEDHFAAAVRELREETGYLIEPAIPTRLVWRADVVYTWLGRVHHTSQAVYRVDVTERPPRGSRALDAAEAGALGDPAWLTAGELFDSGVPVAPFPSVAGWMDLLAAREPIDLPSFGWEPSPWTTPPEVRS